MFALRISASCVALINFFFFCSHSHVCHEYSAEVLPLLSF